MAIHKKIAFNNSTISYYSIGNGSKITFCFHGFSISGKTFLPFEKLIHSENRLIAIDFPWHGDTKWNTSEITPEDFDKIFTLILQEEQLSSTQTYSLLGHSMGGRICLSLYQCFPEKINALILLAPDGLKIAPTYQLLYHSKTFAKIFQVFAQHPTWIQKISKSSYRLKLINKSTFNLVNSSLQSKEDTQLTFLRVMGTKSFYPNIKKIEKLIPQFKTKVYLFFGKYDRIVPAKNAAALNINPKWLKIEVLESGHMILENDTVLPIIAQVIEAL